MRPSVPRRYYYTSRRDDHNYWPPLITWAADLRLMWSSRAGGFTEVHTPLGLVKTPNDPVWRYERGCRLFLFSRVNRFLWQWSPRYATIINNIQTGLEKPYPGETRDSASIFHGEIPSTISLRVSFAIKDPVGGGMFDRRAFAHHPLKLYFFVGTYNLFE